MKKLLSAVFATFLIAGLAFMPNIVVAQQEQYQPITVLTDYDLDSTTPIYAATGNTGTGNEAGKFSVSRFARFNVNVYVSQISVTGGIESRLLCRVSGDGNWQQVKPTLADGTVTPSYVTLSAVGGWYAEVQGPFKDCRVAMQINSADDGNDLTTNLEKVNIRVGGR